MAGEICRAFETAGCKPPADLKAMFERFKKEMEAEGKEVKLGGKGFSGSGYKYDEGEAEADANKKKMARLVGFSFFFNLMLSTAMESLGIFLPKNKKRIFWNQFLLNIFNLRKKIIKLYSVWKINFLTEMLIKQIILNFWNFKNKKIEFSSKFCKNFFSEITFPYYQINVTRMKKKFRIFFKLKFLELKKIHFQFMILQFFAILSIFSWKTNNFLSVSRNSDFLENF